MRDNDHLWERRADFAERHPILSLFYWAAAITLVCLAIAAIVGVASTGSVFFKSGSSNITLQPRENIVRNSTDNAINSIAFFHDTCQDVNRDLGNVTNGVGRVTEIKDGISSLSDPIAQQQARTDLSTAETDLAGLKNVLNSDVTNYNSKAANSIKSKFIEAGLPDRITLPNPIPDGYTVNCG